jgi:hypothetical protein
MNGRTQASPLRPSPFFPRRRRGLLKLHGSWHQKPRTTPSFSFESIFYFCTFFRNIPVSLAKRDALRHEEYLLAARVRIILLLAIPPPVVSFSTKEKRSGRHLLQKCFGELWISETDLRKTMLHLLSKGLFHMPRIVCEAPMVKPSKFPSQPKNRQKPFSDFCRFIIRF